ncbi:hypothetical protein HQ585_06085 [candidate division KSB1 bacterium]|nr:hypothetical protein [candidate division KSB1 bacterium]
MSTDSKSGGRIPIENGIEQTLRKVLKESLKSDLIDALLLPVKVPSGDSYAWILMQDPALVEEEASPMAAVMPVQGAKALKSLTRKGNGSLRVAAMMRPCEVRGTIELSKLNQINLDNVTLISYDCPGALPLSDMSDAPQDTEEAFMGLLSERNFESTAVKPVCQFCTEFSMGAADVHIGMADPDTSQLLLISGSEKGTAFLSATGLKVDEEPSAWEKQTDSIQKKRIQQMDKAFQTIQPMVEGFDNLADTFSNCIGCHNCQSACPICYCRQCYSDSKESSLESAYYLDKAEKRGGISLPHDRLMFHVGRLSHMSLSCVSCGQCTDACPVSIPVAKVFSYVAAQTQQAFEYKAGKTAGEAIPLKEYKEDELKKIHEMTKSAESQESPHE